MIDPEILRRIINSKKMIYAMVPVLANAIGTSLGFDVSHWGMLVLDIAFGMLVIAQTILDAIHGSPSDNTDGPVAVKRLVDVPSVAATVAKEVVVKEALPHGKRE